MCCFSIGCQYYLGKEVYDGSQHSVLSTISAFFELHWGAVVATALRRLPVPVYAADEPSLDPLPWTYALLDHLTDTLCDVPLDVIAKCIHDIAYVPLVFTTKSRRKTYSGFIKHILGHARCLSRMCYDCICNLVVRWFFE